MRPAWETLAIPVLFIPSSITESPGSFRKHTSASPRPRVFSVSLGCHPGIGTVFEGPLAWVSLMSSQVWGPLTWTCHWWHFCTPVTSFLSAQSRGEWEKKIPKALMCQRKKFYLRSALDHQVTLKFQPTGWRAGFTGSLPVTLPSRWLGPFAVRMHRFRPYLLTARP